MSRSIAWHIGILACESQSVLTCPSPLQQVFYNDEPDSMSSQPMENTTTMQQSSTVMESSVITSQSTEETSPLSQVSASQEATSTSGAMGDIIASVVGETRPLSTNSPSPSSSSHTTTAETSAGPATYTGSGVRFVTKGLLLILTTLFCVIQNYGVV